MKSPSLTNIEVLKNMLVKTIDNILHISSDSDPEIRMRAFEVFSDSLHDRVVKQLIVALADPDELVRIAALEALVLQFEIAFPKDIVMEMLNDGDTLVRSAAAVALADMNAVDAIPSLRQKLSGKLDDEECLRYYFALTKLGISEYLPLFLEGFFHDYYRIRCATANLLPALANKYNKSFFISLLNAVLVKEDSEAARSSILSSIEILEYN